MIDLLNARPAGAVRATLLLALIAVTLAACGGSSAARPSATPSAVATSPTPVLYGAASPTLPPATPTPAASPTSAASPTAAPSPTAPAKSPTAKSAPSATKPKPSQPPTRAPAAAPTISAVVGAKPGGTASATVKAAPNAKCDLAFAPPANGAKVALGAKSAPASGALAWSWTVPGGAKPGLGKVTLTCNGLSVSKEIKIG